MDREILDLRILRSILETNLEQGDRQDRLTRMMIATVQRKIDRLERAFVPQAEAA